ncbi:MAG: ArsR/SmtB family transcription factor [Thermoplasmatota archaeon]
MAKITLDAETFKALASATRLSVLRSLDERRKTLSELARDLSLNKATLHEHLTLLSGAGLVKKRDDEGRKWIYYELTWTGEKILHPQETTTFNLLLAAGVAAAGGGVAMLGRVLGLWLQAHPVPAPSAPYHAPAASPTYNMSAGRADSTVTQTFSIATTSSAPAAPASSTAPASAPPPTSAPPSASPPSSQAPPAPAASTTQAPMTTQPPMTTATPAAAAAPTPTSSTALMGRQAASPASSSSTAGAAHAAPAHPFGEEGGWLAVALLLSAVLLAWLAVWVRRTLRPGRFDSSSAEAAEQLPDPQPPQPGEPRP